ncbi:MAG: AAA family ATPase, partial [Prochlorococcus sp.]
MVRTTSVYVCQSCGAQTSQFFGRCASCGNWNSLVEQLSRTTDGRRRGTDVDPLGEPVAIRSTTMALLGDNPLQRLASGYEEFDRVLGGGLVPGSLVLVGGEPGIGKSTLLLQSAAAMALQHSVLYVSAEESAQQVKLRWQRLEGADSGLQLLAETDLDLVLKELEALRPAVVIIDSIQALHDGELSSAPGSVAQVRECAAALQRLAKRQETALVLVGHVT